MSNNSIVPEDVPGRNSILNLIKTESPEYVVLTKEDAKVKQLPIIPNDHIPVLVFNWQNDSSTPDSILVQPTWYPIPRKSRPHGMTADAESVHSIFETLTNPFRTHADAGLYIKMSLYHTGIENVDTGTQFRYVDVKIQIVERVEGGWFAGVVGDGWKSVGMGVPPTLGTAVSIRRVEA